jgi:hypothetical protein
MGDLGATEGYYYYYFRRQACGQGNSENILKYKDFTR